MQLSKIGSKNTYHKCIKELHLAQYIFYHPAPSKFQVVRISVIRLDTEPEQKTPYKQLEMFATKESPPPKGEDLGGGFSTDIDTGSVPDLGHTSTDFDTVPVSKMGHLINQTIKKENSVQNTPTEIFKRNKNLSDKVNELGDVPNPGHDCEEKSSPEGGKQGLGTQFGRRGLPALSEVEDFFRQSNYPADEAQKFFYYNQGKEWMLTDKLRIKDWRSLAHKWMLNQKKQSVKTNQPLDRNRDIQFLYESFIEGKKIFHHIIVAHFEQLKLQLTDPSLQAAWKERLNQVSGSNQHSTDLLWQAYLTYDPENELVKKDRPNFIAIAKRFAVLNHFNQLKQSGQTSLPP